MIPSIKSYFAHYTYFMKEIWIKSLRKCLKMKKKVYRNTPVFVLLSWRLFIFFIALMAIELYTLKEPLRVVEYYLMGSVDLISISFTLAKVARDNQ